MKGLCFRLNFKKLKSVYIDVFESRRLWKILWAWERYNFYNDWKKDKLEKESLWSGGKNSILSSPMPLTDSLTLGRFLNFSRPQWDLFLRLYIFRAVLGFYQSWGGDRFPTYPLPRHMHSLPYYEHPPSKWLWFISCNDESTLTCHYHLKSTVYVTLNNYSTLGVIHSVGLYKYIMTCIQRYSMQSSFTSLKILCAPPIDPSSQLNPCHSLISTVLPLSYT